MGCANATKGVTGPCDPADSGSCVYRLEQGEVAPWTGYLITYRRAAELVVAVDRCHAMAGLRVNTEQAICRAKLARSAADREALAKAHVQQIDALQRRIGASEGSEPWWHRPSAIVMVGIVGVLTGVGSGIYLVR
jgi:hypothetical protein